MGRHEPIRTSLDRIQNSFIRRYRITRAHLQAGGNCSVPRLHVSSSEQNLSLKKRQTNVPAHFGVCKWKTHLLVVVLAVPSSGVMTSPASARTAAPGSPRALVFRVRVARRRRGGASSCVRCAAAAAAAPAPSTLCCNGVCARATAWRAADGAASMEAHRSARCRRAATGLAAQGCPFCQPERSSGCSGVRQLRLRCRASLRRVRRVFACVRLRDAQPIFFVVAGARAASRTRTAARGARVACRTHHERRLPRRPLENILESHSPALGKTGRPSAPTRDAREAATENTLRGPTHRFGQRGQPHKPH